MPGPTHLLLAAPLLAAATTFLATASPSVITPPSATAVTIGSPPPVRPATGYTPGRPVVSSARGGWRWPLPEPGRVLRRFTPPRSPWGPGHRGVDLAARPGVPVRAAGAGRVTFAGRVGGHGVVVVSHGRLRTTYLPVMASVRPGARVAAGERIGVVGYAPGHCGTTPCLHWGLRDGAVYLDPLTLPGLPWPVRLLPVWPATGHRGSPLPPR